MTDAAWDADWECRHGRIPFDPCPSPDGCWPHPFPCSCFPAERGEPMKLVPAEPKGSLCACGCGLPTKLSDRTRRGVRKGEPLRYLHGHNMRKAA